MLIPFRPSIAIIKETKKENLSFSKQGGNIMDILSIINAVMALFRKILDAFGDDIMKELFG